MNKLFLSLAFLLVTTGSLIAQDTTAVEEKRSLDSGPIEERFEYMIDRSNRYQDYRVVKQTWLYKLKQHVVDSLQILNEQLSEARETIADHKAQKDSMIVEVAEINDTANELREEKNSLSFMGIMMEKNTFLTLMWLVYAALIVALLMFIYKYRNSNKVTVETRQTLEETREEFEAHKKRSMEKEQVLRRELQDEINKHNP